MILLPKFTVFGLLLQNIYTCCTHTVQKRALELPEYDDVVEKNELEQINAKVMAKRSAHRQHQIASALLVGGPNNKNVVHQMNGRGDQSTASVISKAKHNKKQSHSTKRRLYTEKKTSEADSSRNSVKGVKKHLKKERKPEDDNKVNRHTKTKKYVIPKALNFWKPAYVLSPNIAVLGVANTRALPNARQYYKYLQYRNRAIQNAMRLRSLQGRNAALRYNAGAYIRPAKPGIQYYGSNKNVKTNGQLKPNIPPAGQGRLPQNQQTYNTHGSTYNVKGGQVNKVLTAPKGLSKVIPKGSAKKLKPEESSDKGDFEANKDKSEEGGKSKLRYGRKHNVKGSLRDRIHNKDESDDGDDEGDKDDNENDSSNDGDEDTGDGDESTGDDGSNDEDNSETNSEAENDSESDMNGNSDNGDENESEDDSGDGDAESSGISRSKIEHDEDNETGEDGDGESQTSQNKNNGNGSEEENQEDGTQDNENDEDDEITAPEEASQYQQDIDGPVDPANTPARDTGDDNTPPAAEETFTSRSTVDDSISP